jgi:hypothetical protein
MVVQWLSALGRGERAAEGIGFHVPRSMVEQKGLDPQYRIWGRFKTSYVKKAAPV